jgi:hypothetical protein
VGEGLRHRDGAALGLGAGLPLGLQQEGDDGERHEQHNEHRLEQEDLPSDAAGALADQ